MTSLELKVPPLAVFAVAAAAMATPAGVRALSGAPLLPMPLSAPLLAASIALGLAGIGIAGAGVFEFRSQHTTVNPLAPARAARVVSSGVYRWSRNPMYLGMLLALAAWALVLPSWVALAVLPMFVIYMNRFQILPEERVLREKFGAPYGEYLRKVRRWI